MTILTPKFDLPKPEGTDLISNGYDAIADLADSVEALLGAMFPQRADPGPAPAWTTYTPTWTASTTNPSLGNGSLIGTWTKVERLVFWRAALTFGSTTTPGSGIWFLGLPLAGGPATPTVGFTTGRGALVDTSAGLRNGRDVLINAATTFCLISEAGVYTSGPSTPWTWAVGDSVSAAGWYQADS